VTFSLTEVLMGQNATAVGRGNGIQGNVTVDFDDYTKSTISPVVIDATALATDSNMRNGMIRRAILQTNNAAYHDITFKPTEIAGLPREVTMGQPFDISVTGDLTIRDVTKPATFAVTVTPVSESQIEGSAKATVMRDDFNLTIPSVPTVADVSQEVQLTFDFVANAE
jgi:polyisoprenoid-binding protein YceI